MASETMQEVSLKEAANPTAAKTASIMLARIPAFSHAFVRYLWCTLVLPVALYGMEVYTWTNNQAKEMRQILPYGFLCAATDGPGKSVDGQIA